MRATALSLLVAVAALAALAADRPAASPGAAKAAGDAPRATSALPESLKQLQLVPRKHAPQATACAACHSTSSWADTRFNHAKTGFPLLGKHTATPCKACHPVDYQRSVPASCSGCHLDVHAGELGGRCEGCHDSNSWKSRFPADAHRFSGFPLVGRHAALPCGECHFTEATGRFSRAASACVECHQADYDRTAGTSLDHATLGFPPTCQGCHQAWSFKGARFPGHDSCFEISRGSHAVFTCAQCHTGFPPGLSAGSCSTGTAFCIECHTGDHSCARSDQQHAGVLGYRCQIGQDQKCYGCHKVTGAGR